MILCVQITLNQLQIRLVTISFMILFRHVLRMAHVVAIPMEEACPTRRPIHLTSFSREIWKREAKALKKQFKICMRRARQLYFICTLSLILSLKINFLNFLKFFSSIVSQNGFYKTIYTREENAKDCRKSSLGAERGIVLSLPHRAL